MSFKHAWDPKSKQTPEQIEKRLTAERDASRQLARQLEWRLLALERTLTAEQRTQLGTSHWPARLRLTVLQRR